MTATVAPEDQARLRAHGFRLPGEHAAGKAGASHTSHHVCCVHVHIQRIP